MEQYTVDKNKMKKTNVTFVIIGFMILFFIILLIIAFAPSKNNNKEPNDFYIGETFNYNNVHVTINDVSCEEITNTFSSYYGLYSISVEITFKNNRTENFEVEPWNDYIKTEDKGEKYEIHGFSAILDKTKIIPGASRTYTYSFYSTYSLEQKKFSFHFNSFDNLEYHLYNKSI